MTEYNGFPRVHQRFANLLAAVLVSLLLATAPLAAQDEQWVRVYLDEGDGLTDQLSNSDRLADYGTMLFGQLDGATIAQLEASGHRVQVTDNPFLLTLGGETFDPVRRGTSNSIASALGGEFKLIQFDGPIRSEWVSDLQRSGLQVVQPLHPFSYIVWSEGSQLDSALALENVRWAGRMETEWKVQSHLRDFDDQPRPTMLLASAHGDVEARIARLRELGNVTVVSPVGRHLLAIQINNLPGSAYTDLASWPDIYTVQYIRPEAGPRGEMSNQSIVGNIDGGGTVLPGYATWLSDTGYNGAGVTVGVVDGRVLATHVDLADRMLPCNGTNGSCAASGTDDHGTHVAGAIAGTGATGALLNGFLRGQGVAPGANIVTQRYQPFLGGGPGGMNVDGMLDIYQDSARSGALLTNNSWGPTGSPQGYDIPTQQIDFITRDADPDTAGDQPVLPVWSIMNGNGDSSGACSPSSLGSPDEAKNLFAVGSTALQSGSGAQLSNIFRISTNSAHGNACDGRRRPDIVAPGCSTDSTTNASNTAHSANFCGTSMASPVVSGSVSVFWEKYLADNGVNPSPALVKAVFTAAAQDLVGNPNADGGIMGHRPDRFQGYGRVDLDLVMNHGLEVYMHDQATVFTNSGDDFSIGLNAVNPSEPIRIMLAWTDAPGHGMGGTTPAWVNNLDLTVGANGSTYLGNVIGGDGWSATGGNPDERNNLEGVFLNPSQHGGAVNITVSASDLAGDALDPWNPGAPSQDFALVCYNCIVGNPTFTLSASPSPVEACVPDAGSNSYPATIDLGTIGAYTGTVTLDFEGVNPTGVGGSFSPSSVSVPGSSTLTLTVDSTATPSATSVVIRGNDGSEVKTTDLLVNLDALLGNGPTLDSPADGAVGIDFQPTLSWIALAGVSDYSVQVSTDPSFGSFVVDEVVSGNSFIISSDLASGTQYYWRVAGINNCGAGNFSTTNDFTTRQEPVAEFSSTSFTMTTGADVVDFLSLSILNTGTGDLTWSSETDEAPAGAGRGSVDPTLDEALAVPDFTITGGAGGGTPASFTIPAGVATRGTVLGFEFEGTVSGITGNGDWASDMVLVLTGPDGDSFSVGGFTSPVNDWDFQGGGSSEDGTYVSAHLDAFIPGTGDIGNWTASFQHGWESANAGSMNWSNVTLTLKKAPLPICNAPFTAVPWLDVQPSSGVVGEGGSEHVVIEVDTMGLSDGQYEGYVCISTNDPAAPMTAMPVLLEVLTGFLFRDRFED
ncbi:MAG: S8 family serine peptidase [Pseudomonadota bacterium]